MRCWRDSAPLCPAGHLPLKGGDRTASLLSPISDVEEKNGGIENANLPLEGEMPGRAEGGAKDRDATD
ncbi:lytic murein transglycosylase [Mesorhizobium sp. M7A.F.Ca.US.014.04.1.1]|nr:lytic murein transglycosylase [Mesorhizobium sp. Primo-B]RUU24370.1 lytic murein transglycosylase [Mesorhizobium sp. M6A.T.Ce.TU.016.01.1.1]RUU35683.1 lytic murein transglycosylase [Mesorhizobium sp. Primo-A]RUU94287.1 lytic murein transglycosylase [Mesorhizobium sp. M6A.T.Cr.TU.017.01.1.1]RUX15037.1 lytic murein transglycosylase [Mesorhizobium sp. M7A.F.Ca.CA.002.14.1.2]RUX39071.1 lytic murein transglycosylase [Mesorhizobium sp. M7A.F.Ca.CA.002.11.2.1]RUX49350.1 lytic murein transglycosyl